MLNFTTESPTIPGFYYYRDNSHKGDEVSIVQVTMTQGGWLTVEELIPISTVYDFGAWKKRIGTMGHFRGEWAGPIPQPNMKSYLGGRDEDR